MIRIALVVTAVSILASLACGDALPKPPSKFLGMLPNGKPFITTMYYERFYNYPDEYALMDRDLEDLAARGWTVAYTDYIHLSLGPVWDHYYDTAKRLGIYVLPDQWNAAFHAGGPFFSRIKLPITETGATPTGFGIGCVVRYNDPSFISAMADYQSQVISRYIEHPAYPRILGRDGKLHPVMIVIYETGMADYDGHWIEYSPDTKAQWVEFQKERLGKVIAEEPPKPSELDKKDALVLWNEFRAKYIADGWGAVARELKKRFPGLYTMVIFRQHGLLEGSKSGVNAGGIGRRAIRPEIWKDFDIIASEHDGDDGIQYALADADLMKSAGADRMSALVYYLDSGYKAWSARPVEFHRPWGQSEMLGSLAIRGMLPLHYGYNERDDRAGIASTGRREKDAPLWQPKSCEEAAAANKVFLGVAPYLYAAKPSPAKAAIVMPYEAYALRNDDELSLDRRLVQIWQMLNKCDVPMDWVFSTAKTLAPYKLLIVPDAPYSKEFESAVSKAEKKGTRVIRVSLDGAGDEGIADAVSKQAKELRTSHLPAKPGVETALLVGKGYEVDAVVNHSEVPVTYDIKGQGTAFPVSAHSSPKLTVPAHSSTYWVRASG